MPRVAELHKPKLENAMLASLLDFLASLLVDHPAEFDMESALALANLDSVEQA